MLMALDQFVFDIATLPYNELQRQSSWKHRSASRVGARDANQYTGPGEDAITLNGTFVAELSNALLLTMANVPHSLDDLRAMADTGDGYVLIDGLGKVYGTYVIESIHENQTYINQFGRPQKIDFTISLKRVDDALATFYIQRQ